MLAKAVNWKFNSEGFLLLLHTYQVNQMGPQPAPLYFWSCIWFSSHGHGPADWWIKNKGILFVVGREKKLSLFIRGLGDIQSILRFALLKYFIMLPCRQQLQQEALICLVLSLFSSHECNIWGWNFITPASDIHLKTQPAYSDLFDGSENAEMSWYISSNTRRSEVPWRF